jgi:hypothetical protein
MNPETLRQFLSVRPFEPLEVLLSSGQVLLVKHPENVMLLKNTIVVADPEADAVQWCSLIHVVGTRRGKEALPA